MVHRIAGFVITVVIALIAFSVILRSGQNQQPQSDADHASIERTLPAKPGDPAIPGEPEPQIMWSIDPIRIERKPGDVYRLPPKTVAAEFPVALAIPKNVRVHDNATFSFGGNIYRITRVVPMDPTQICTDTANRRYACGTRGRITFRNLIAGRRLNCKFLRSWGNDNIIDCKVGISTLSQLLSKSGNVASRTD